MVDQAKLDTRVRHVMEDPSAQVLARVYAHALLDAAKSVGVEGVLEEYRSLIVDVLDPNPEFRQLMQSGVVGRDEHLGIIDRTLVGRGSEFFVNFLKVLARHDRLELLRGVLKEAEIEWERRSGKRRVQVQSAVPLSDEQRRQIGERLQQSMGFTPVLESSVDPGLLGGLVIRVGDTVYDSSLRSRLKQLRERFRTRKVHEIQSGRDRFSHPA